MLDADGPVIRPSRRGNDVALTDIELITEPDRHKRLTELVAAYGMSAS
jgi:hypothetical protein